MPEQTLPEYLKETGNGIKIELKTPIDIDGADVSTLTMREPTVQDQLDVDAMKGSPATKEVSLMANLCEISPDDIKKMPMRNYKRLQVALEVFTE
jgi:hypothetical protein